MTVVYKNQLFNLDYDYDTFENHKRNNPRLKVRLSPLTDTSYTYNDDVLISELEDWSKVRNLNALGK